VAEGNLARRLAFAAVAIPAVLLAAWLGGWALALLLAALGALGAREVFDLAGRQGIDPLRRLGMLGAAGAPLLVALGLVGPRPGAWAELLEYLGALWFLLVLSAAVSRRGPQGRPLAAVAVTVFGAMYGGWLLCFALLLRHPAPGPLADGRVGTALLLFPLVLTWAGDTAAYAGGTAIGGAKLAPVISPAKTWSGAAAGLFATVAVGLLYAAVVFARVGVSVGLGEALVLGLAIGLVGQFGDLAESLLKREAGLKDSSSLIPGHGGVLDRLDSLYFVLPVTALLLGAMGIA
jgi:phosphatidate cytidylyltransferase